MAARESSFFKMQPTVWFMNGKRMWFSGWFGTPRCPECGYELEWDEDECPNCGALLGDYEEFRQFGQ